MKRVALLILWVVCSVPLIAQSRRTVRIPAGEDVALTYSPNGFYRFPQFRRAVVYLKNGGGNDKLLFNYNVLSGTMQFISPTGDTLDMAQPSMVDSIAFENSLFYQRDGFMEVWAANDSIRLLKKIVIKFHREGVAGYGISNPVSSVVNLQNYSTRISWFNLRLNQDIVLDEATEWYWIDKNNKIAKATKANLLSMLPASRHSDAEAYIKKNRVNFEKGDQLMRLLLSL